MCALNEGQFTVNSCSQCAFRCRSRRHSRVHLHCSLYCTRTHAPTSTPMPPTPPTQRVSTGQRRVEKSRVEERAPDAADTRISARIHRQRHTTRVLTPCARLSLSRPPNDPRRRLPPLESVCLTVLIHLSQHFHRSSLVATCLMFGTRVNGWALSPTACHQN